jgi:hypothetical protein
VRGALSLGAAFLLAGTAQAQPPAIVTDTLSSRRQEIYAVPSPRGRCFRWEAARPLRIEPKSCSSACWIPRRCIRSSAA